MCAHSAVYKALRPTSSYPQPSCWRSEYILKVQGQVVVEMEKAFIRTAWRSRPTCHATCSVDRRHSGSEDQILFHRAAATNPLLFDDNSSTGDVSETSCIEHCPCTLRLRACSWHSPMNAIFVDASARCRDPSQIL
nr:hypothetical protein CFP56_67018 [Quercus suber]